MFAIFAQYSYSLPKMDQLLPEMPPPDLLLLSLSTAAWIAALSAAVGLWRLKSPGSKSHSTTSKSPLPTPPGPAEEAPMPGPTPPAAAAAAPPPPTPPRHVEGGALGSPRSRFTVSYSSCDVDVDEDCSCHVEEEESGEDAWEVREPRWMGARGDLGWYRYQDRTAIDGSVVRLWDLDGGLAAEARRGSSLSLVAGAVRVQNRVCI